MNQICAFLMGQCHVGLVGNPGSYVLIDAGFPGTMGAFLRAIKRIGAEPKDIRAIVITHFHYDHVGCLARIRDLSGAGVIVHAAEAEAMRKGEMLVPVGTNRFARAIVRAFRGPAARPHRTAAGNPTIVIDREYDLSRFGVGGRIIPTPGHTRGSVSVILDSGDAFIGDAAANMPLVNRKSVFPPFAEEPAKLAQTWAALLETNAGTFHPAHGGPFDRAKLAASLAAFPWARTGSRPSKDITA